MKKIDGPQNFELFKYLPGLIYNTPETLYSLSLKYPEIIRFGLGKEYFLFVNNPEIIKHILKTNYKNYVRGVAIDDLRPLLGNGVLASEDDLWREMRKLISPPFHSRSFENLCNVLEKSLVTLFDRWKDKIVIDVEYEMTKLVAEVTYKSLFSQNISTDLDIIISELEKIYKNSTFGKHSFRMGLKQLFKNNPNIGVPKKIIIANKILDEHAAKIVNDAIDGKIIPQEYLKILIDAAVSNLISTQQIIDEIKNIIFAGFDTVAETLTWLLILIDKEKESSKKMKEEIFGNVKGDFPNEEEIQNLNYQLMFIKEGMRLFPVAWAFHRIALEDDEIDGYSIKKNAWIMMSPYVLHRSPKLWDNPLKFNPLRFEGETSTIPVRFDYMPFGQGPHTCLGNRMAMFEMQFILAALLKKYSLTFINGNNSILADIIIRPRKKIFMKVNKI